MGHAINKKYFANIIDYVHLPGGIEGEAATILKQESSRRYIVKTKGVVKRQGICKLVAKSPSYLNIGEMCLIATDTTGSTYFVTKLTANRASLVRYSSTGPGWKFNSDSVVGWTYGPATATRVSITTV
jgi:hypothetical protein